MICENIKVFSQNIHKNSLIIYSILETCSDFDIIFIQKLFWTCIHSILSPLNCEGKELVGIPNHPNWVTFSRNPTNIRDFPRVLVYINIYISFLHFFLCNDIFNYKDISCILFFNQGSIQFLLNVYSNSSQLALKYLKNTEVDLNNVLLIMDDFNIRDCLWNPSFIFHSSFRNILFDITDSFYLELSKPTENFLTMYSDNDQDSNSVLDLVFLCPESTEFNSHHIHPDWRLFSNHAPITVNIPIFEEQVQVSKHVLIKNSKEED